MTYCIYDCEYEHVYWTHLAKFTLHQFLVKFQIRIIIETFLSIVLSGLCSTIAHKCAVQIYNHMVRSSQGSAVTATEESAVQCCAQAKVQLLQSLKKVPPNGALKPRFSCYSHWRKCRPMVRSSEGSAVTVTEESAVQWSAQVKVQLLQSLKKVPSNSV